MMEVVNVVLLIHGCMEVCIQMQVKNTAHAIHVLFHRYVSVLVKKKVNNPKRKHIREGSGGNCVVIIANP